NALALANAARDDGDGAGRALDHDRSLSGRVALIHDVHVRAALPGHDRLRRDDERAVLVEEMQRSGRELPGPQAAILVLEHRFELHGGGRRIDCVVDERELPGHAVARNALLRDGSICGPRRIGALTASTTTIPAAWSTSAGAH